MELNLYKDTVKAAQLICEAKIELSVETEFLISDYLPQVFKVVKCFVVPVVLQKQISAGRLTVEGYLRCLVFYQAEGEGTLCQTEQKIPFSKQCECRQGEYDYTYAPIEISGEAEYLNCRAVSGRRIEVRGAYALSARAYAYECNDIVTVANAEHLYQKSTEIHTTAMVGAVEKMVTLEQEISFEKEPEMILHTQCSSDVQEVRFMENKAVIKGEVHAEVFYRTQGNHEILCTSQNIPFQEILDLEQAEESCTGQGILKVIGCTIAQGEEKEMLLSVSCSASVRVWKQTNLVGIEDVFSTAQHLEVIEREVLAHQMQPMVNETITAQVSGELNDQIQKIIFVLATPLSLEMTEEGGGTSLRGRVMVHVFCENEAGEIECYDKVCEYTPECYFDAANHHVCFLSNVQVKGVEASISANQLSAQVTLQVTGCVSVAQAYRAVSDIHEGELRQKNQDGAALYVYFAQEGESLFDIAKRYAAPPEFVGHLNEQHEEVLKEARRLLIPQGL